MYLVHNNYKANTPLLPSELPTQYLTASPHSAPRLQGRWHLVVGLPRQRVLHVETGSAGKK